MCPLLLPLLELIEICERPGRGYIRRLRGGQTIFSSFLYSVTGELVVAVRIRAAMLVLNVLYPEVHLKKR